MDDLCVHGKWVEGVCVCNKGYDTGFNHRLLYPKYCENEKVTVIKVDSYVTSEELLYYAAMALTVLIATWSILAVNTLCVSIGEKIKLHKSTKKVEQEWKRFSNEQRNYDTHVMLDAALWDPSSRQFKCIVSSQDKPI